MNPLIEMNEQHKRNMAAKIQNDDKKQRDDKKTI